MPKVKTKPKKARYVEDDDDDFLPPEPEPAPAPEPVVERPVYRGDPSMILDLDGHAGAIASALVVNGMRAYLSVVNKGVNVVAANRAHTAFVPVKVAGCEFGLDIKRDEARPLVPCGGVLAFLLEGDEERASYYIPAAEYLTRAEDRGESGLRLDLDAHADWLAQYEGHAGVRRAFASLLAEK